MSSSFPQGGPPMSAPPFGPVASVFLGFSVLVGAHMVALTLVTMLNMLANGEGAAQLETALREDPREVGRILLRTLCLSSIAAVAMARALVNWRIPGQADAYLMANPVRWPNLRPWLVYVIAFAFAAMVVEWFAAAFFGVTQPEESFDTLGYGVLTFTAVVLAAPLMEETIFRGLIFSGLEQSRVGQNGAIVITTLLWAGLHVQYNFFGMLIVGAFGVVLCLSRIHTNSVLTPILLHAVYNGVLVTASLIFAGGTAPI